MLLYHGSYLEIKSPQTLAGKYAKDFGIGFLCVIQFAVTDNCQIQIGELSVGSLNPAAKGSDFVGRL